MAQSDDADRLARLRETVPDWSRETKREQDAAEALLARRADWEDRSILDALIAKRRPA